VFDSRVLDGSPVEVVDGRVSAGVEKMLKDNLSAGNA
jgi:hypothetical protein